MEYQIDGVAIVTDAGKLYPCSRIVKLNLTFDHQAVELRKDARSHTLLKARGVVIADLDYNAVLKTARECNSQAMNPSYAFLAIAVDVTDTASIEHMVQTAVEAFGRIDYSVHSAGIGIRQYRPVGEANLDEMHRFWAGECGINCVQAVTKVMKDQSVARITDSCASVESEGCFRQRGLLNAALDSAQYKIRINAICPGWVDAPMLSAAGGLPESMLSTILMLRVAQMEEVADVTLFMMCPGASYVTGDSVTD